MNQSFLKFLLIIALISSCIELEISAPSFPGIASVFQVTDPVVGLTITYNLLGFCLASIIFGPLSECYGRRPVMVIGNAILAIGAAACVFAPSISWLLLARFIEGIGAATSAVVVSAIIADSYKEAKAAKLYGVMNAIFTTLMALAPVIGGFINNAIGWRGNYGVVALVCLISWLLLYLYLPETHQAPKSRRDLNLKQMIKDYKTLLSSPIFLSASAVPSLLYGCYMAFVAIGPFLYMQTFKLDILIYTFHQAFIVAAFAITSMLASFIAASLGNKKTILVALMLCLSGSSLLLTASGPYALSAYMSLMSIGSAMMYPILFARSVEIFPQIKGTASSAIMAMRYLLCSALTGLANYFYDGTPAKLTLVIFITVLLILTLSLQLIRKLNLKN